MAEKRECTGSEIGQGKLKTLHLCHDACKGKASMFIYGMAPSLCDGDGCSCYCEASSMNGECTMKDHQEFNLYAYVIVKGEIVLSINFFRYLQKIFWNDHSHLSSLRLRV